MNIINHILCYSDGVVTDSPHQRDFDHRLRLESISVKNPYGNAKTLAPGESFSLFENVIATALDNTSTVQIAIVSQQDSVYRLSASAGPSGFRTARTPTGITACNVTVNNNSVAVFNFTSATLSGVQVGDILQIAGVPTYDAGPFAFNPINSGIWKIIGISGTKISATRMSGVAFAALPEAVATVNVSDVKIYADDKVRPGMQFQISNTFSQVTQRTFTVLNSTSTSIDFVSTAAIPEENSLTYVPNSVVFYTGIKRMVYVDADQECAIRFNDATDDSNRITPITPGDFYLRGFMNKLGNTYSCTIINKSVNTCNIRFFTVE